MTRKGFGGKKATQPIWSPLQGSRRWRLGVNDGILNLQRQLQAHRICIKGLRVSVVKLEVGGVQLTGPLSH